MNINEIQLKKLKQIDRFEFRQKYQILRERNNIDTEAIIGIILMTSGILLLNILIFLLGIISIPFMIIKMKKFRQEINNLIDEYFEVKTKNGYS
jgi:hypothetical protein